MSRAEDDRHCPRCSTAYSEGQEYCLECGEKLPARPGVSARLEPDPSKPTGPYNRVADNALARKLLDWTPRVSFSDGLDRTIKWYYESKRADLVGRDLERLLTER